MTTLTGFGPEHMGVTRADAPQPLQDESIVLRTMYGAAHFVGLCVSVLSLRPYSTASAVSAEGASPDRRAGDKVNPMKVDISGFVSTTHRT